MISRRIVVRVRPDGSLHAETQGIKGDACLAYIPIIEALTEARTVSSHFTSEYREPSTLDEETPHHQRLEQGE
jgi:hypothetical protein